MNWFFIEQILWNLSHFIFTSIITAFPSALIHQVLTKEILQAVHGTLTCIDIIYFTGIHCSFYILINTPINTLTKIRNSLPPLVTYKTGSYILFNIIVPFVFSFPGTRRSFYWIGTMRLFYPFILLVIIISQVKPGKPFSSSSFQICVLFLSLTCSSLTN